MALAKEQIRQMITENNITNVGDIYSFLKNSFKDVLQEILEAEMESLNHKSCKSINVIYLESKTK